MLLRSVSRSSDAKAPTEDREAAAIKRALQITAKLGVRVFDHCAWYVAYQMDPTSVR